MIYILKSKVKTMYKIITKSLTCAIILMLWFDIRNLFHINLQLKDVVLLGGLLVSAILPYVLKKNIVIPLCVSLAITVGMCIYEIAYLVWAVPMLCLLYAYIISRDETKSLRHKTRLHISELLIIGMLAMIVPIVIKIKTFVPDTYYNFKTTVPVMVVYTVLFAVAFHTAFFRKAQHKDKQTAKLLSAVYIVAAAGFLAESIFYKLMPYFIYCDYKFILLPWVIFICFIAATDDPNVKRITDTIDQLFDKFAKLTVEKE